MTLVGHVLIEVFCEIEVEDLEPRDADVLEKAYVQHLEGFLSNLRGRTRTVSLDVYVLPGGGGR